MSKDMNCEADARLIAAAPEMLDAIEEILADCDALIAAAPEMLDAIEEILADCDAQDADPSDYRVRYFDLHVGHVKQLQEIVAKARGR